MLDDTSSEDEGGRRACRAAVCRAVAILRRPHDITGGQPSGREAALAHTVKNNVERAYRRGDLFDLRCDLMARWANHIEGRTADIRPIRKRSAA